MTPYFSFNKKESILLMICFITLILLMSLAGWIFGNISRQEKSLKDKNSQNTAAISSKTGKTIIPKPGQAAAEQAKKIKKDSQRLKDSGTAGIKAVKDDASEAEKDSSTSEKAGSGGSPAPELKKQKRPASGRPSAADASKPDAAGGAGEKGQSPPGSTRFSVITDTFVVKTKALNRVKELKEKGYPEALILRFDISNGSDDTSNYLIQIGSFTTFAEAKRLSSEFQEKENNVAVIRPMSVSDLKEKVFKEKGKEKSS